MEPRPNELKTAQPRLQELSARPESRLRTRFFIEALEERIAPNKYIKSGGDKGTGGTDGGTSYGL